MSQKFVALLSLSLMVAACGAAPTALRQAPADAGAMTVQARSYTLDQMGIGKKHIRSLSQAGITNAAQLLEAAKSVNGRNKLIQTTGIDPTRLLELVNMADMMRVKGVGPGQSRLLLGVGVRTVKDLAQRNPATLAELLAALNDETRLLERNPGPDTVAKWIEEARTLARVITY